MKNMENILKRLVELLERLLVLLERLERSDTESDSSED